jgi:putative ABC transport system permease protein
VLTLLGIAIGVAAVVAVRVASDTALSAYRTMFRAAAGRADLEVVGDGLSGLDPAALEPLVRAVPGVEAVVPVVQLPAALVAPSGNVRVLLLGIDPARDALVREHALREGRLPAADDDMVLEAGFARANGWEVGEPVVAHAPAGRVTFRVAGLVDATGAALFDGGAVALVTLDAARRMFLLGRGVTALQVVLSRDADAEDAAAAIARVLPPRARVAEPGARAALSRDSLLSTELGLAAVSVMSLVAGAFIILNTFLMNVAERRRQIAILRSLGATRGQVVRLFLREAAALGVAGTVLGAVFGLSTAAVLVEGVERLLRIRVPALVVGWEPLALALVLGPLLSVGAAWAPAHRASRRPALQGLREDRTVAREDRPRRTVWVGLGLLGLTLVAEVGFVKGWLSGWAVAPFMATALTGFVLAFPLVQPLLLRLVRPLAPALLGVEGRLAMRQVERRPHRTAVTVGVLFLAVAVGIGTGHSLLNNIDEVRDWYDRTLVEDFFLRATMPDTGVADSPSLPETVGAEVAALPGVARVDRVRFVPARANGQHVVLLAKSLTEGGRAAPLEFVDGDPKAAAEGLARGEVVPGTALAARLGLRAGDALTLETPSGPRAVRVAGTAVEYTVGGMAVYMEFDAARHLLGFRGVDAYPVTARAGQVPRAEESLRRFARERGYLLQSRAELWSAVDQMVDGVVNLLWTLLVLVFVVASLGVVNTLAMSVVEQTREIGLLRAVGTTRGQVAKVVLAQAAVVGLLSLVPGALGGLALAWLQNQATYPLLGHHVAFAPVPWLVGGCLALALLAAVLSAALPARRAARLQVVKALQYE